MNTAVLITLILCITLVIICGLGTLNTYLQTHKPRTFLEILGIDNKEDNK